MKKLPFEHILRYGRFYACLKSSCIFPIKVFGCYSVTFLKQTPLFEWFVVRYGSKNKHCKDTCSKEIGLHLQILLTTLYSRVNTTGGSLNFLKELTHALPITIMKS